MSDHDRNRLFVGALADAGYKLIGWGGSTGIEITTPAEVWNVAMAAYEVAVRLGPSSSDAVYEMPAPSLEFLSPVSTIAYWPSVPWIDDDEHDLGGEGG